MARNVTDTDIEALRDESGANNDGLMVELCNSALRGDTRHRAVCEARIIAVRDDRAAVYSCSYRTDRGRCRGLAEDGSGWCPAHTPGNNGRAA